MYFTEAEYFVGTIQYPSIGKKTNSINEIRSINLIRFISKQCHGILRQANPRSNL